MRRAVMAGALLLAGSLPAFAGSHGRSASADSHAQMMEACLKEVRRMHEVRTGDIRPSHAIKQPEGGLVLYGAVQKGLDDKPFRCEFDKGGKLRSVK